MIIYTPSGEKEVTLNQTSYTLESILDLDENTLNIFNSIFSTTNRAELLNILNSNNLLEVSDIDIFDKSFTKLILLEKSEIVKKGLTIGVDYGNFSYSQIILSIYRANKLHNLLVSEEKGKFIVPTVVNGGGNIRKSLNSKPNFVQLGKILADQADPVIVPTIRIAYPVIGSIDINSIVKRRKVINEYAADKLFNGDFNMEQIRKDDLRALTELYDEILLNGIIKRMFKGSKWKLDFDISGATRSAGLCKTIGCSYTISISWPVFKDLFKSGSKEEHYSINGILCYNKLECLQVVLEHELMHMISDTAPDIPNPIPARDRVYSAHGLLFKQLVMAFYGHTGVTHSLHIDQSKVSSKSDFEMGDVVNFELASGENLTGRIIKMNPVTAVILTAEGLKYKSSYRPLKKVSGDISKYMEIKEKPKVGKSDFSMGQFVRFRSVHGIKTGKIVKMHPVNAIVSSGPDTYKVPYSELI